MECIKNRNISKINNGEICRTSDKKIDTAEMRWVLGEPVSKKYFEKLLNSPDNTHLNSQAVQSCAELEHQLEVEKLKNEYLPQKASDQKAVNRELSTTDWLSK